MNRDTPNTVPHLEDATISKAAFRRLPRYHQILKMLSGRERRYVSSIDLARMLEINETLVRKDIADLRVRGRQNLGYPVEALLHRLEEYLGLQETTMAVLVGAGHLGQALAQFSDFEHFGLRIAAVFDNDPDRIGKRVGGANVLHVDHLAPTIRREKIRLLILTTPKSVAQALTDIAVEAGVRAVWNFTPQELTAPEDVYIRNEQIVAGFMAVSHFLKNLPAEKKAEEAAPAPSLW